MPFKTRSIISCIAFSLLLSFAVSGAAEGPDESGGVYNLPPLPAPEVYGNILIDRRSSARKVKPVTFSHWLHRRKYTCRVCHSELEFTMKVNTTEITEADNRAGRYCGACHNGRIAFRHNGNCDKCHNGDIAYSAEKFAEFDTQPFPRTLSGYGNGINWVEALRKGMIRPASYLKQRSQDNVSFERTFFFPSEGGNFIAPAIFPHKAHVEWLDCSSCHPDLFTIKQRGTRNLSMNEIVQGNFCGVCHLTVALPLNDCKGCHPGQRDRKP